MFERFLSSSKKLVSRGLNKSSGRKFRIFYDENQVYNENAKLINELVTNKQSLGTFLEIGIEHGITFEAVRFKKKIGVDPNPLFYNFRPYRSKVIRDTSDNFFNTLELNTLFQFIYIDGLHVFDQVFRDLTNSLMHLDQFGTILIDDTIPADEFSALPSFEECVVSRKRQTGIDSTVWHGDVFKIVHLLAEEFTDSLEYFTLGDAWNPKTVVKFRHEKNNEMLRKKISSINLEKYRRIEFKEAFIKGVTPKFFNVVTTTSAIRTLHA